MIFNNICGTLCTYFSYYVLFITLDLTAIQVDLEGNEETIEAKISVKGDIMEYCKHMAWGLLNYRKKSSVS